MSRRKKEEGHENHERWLVSYADFITLLFAFFVVMYAISSVNEGKYRVLSDALVAAFRNPRESVEPVQLGDLTRPSKSKSSTEFIERPRLPMPMGSVRADDSDQQESATPQDEAQASSRAQLVTIAEAIRQALQQLVDQGLVNIRDGGQYLEVEIKDSVLFPSASARLQPEAVPVLQKVAAIVRDFPNPIRVEGFTDNLPIDTLLYPSNWELSGARAASVVRLLAGEGVAPTRLSALGYGEFRPIADNGTPEGRAQNRRVVMVVLADDQTEQALEHGQSPAAPPPGPNAATGAAPAAQAPVQSPAAATPAPEPVQEPAPLDGMRIFGFDSVP